MSNVTGYSLLVVLPMIAGILAIALPFLKYHRTRKESALTVGIINSVFCGACVLELGTVLFLGWGISPPIYAVLAGGFIAMLVVVWPIDAKR